MSGRRQSVTRLGETTVEDAIDIATDMIEAAARFTKTVPAGSGIGGPIDVKVIGRGARPARHSPSTAR
jgi:hypothetical protein